MQNWVKWLVTGMRVTFMQQVVMGNSQDFNDTKTWLCIEGLKEQDYKFDLKVPWC